MIQVELGTVLAVHDLQANRGVVSALRGLLRLSGRHAGERRHAFKRTVHVRSSGLGRHHAQLDVLLRRYAAARAYESAAPPRR